jgi:exosortase
MEMELESVSPTAAPVADATEKTPAIIEPALWKRLSSVDWAILGVFVLMCAPFFRSVWEIWSAEEAPQAYALLILPASLFLAWMLRHRLKDAVIRFSPTGVVVLLLGIGILAFGTMINQATIGGIGFVLSVVGLVLTRYGAQVARALWFPLAFLTAMIPLPHELLNVITFPLQGISVKWAALLLKPMGDVTVQGTRIILPNYTMEVIAPCSGLTIVLPLFILTIYYMYIVAAPVWKKLTLIALTLPIAMIVNAFRVAITGLVGDMFGTKAGEAAHDYGGLITVAVGFAVLYFIAQEMKCHRIADEITL